MFSQVLAGTRVGGPYRTFAALLLFKGYVTPDQQQFLDIEAPSK
jgi:hypothetical protein